MTEAAPAAPEDSGQADPGQGQSAENGAGNENENEAKAWYDVEGVTDEQKGFVQNKGWDDPLKALTAYQELEKFQGVPADQLIKLPKDITEAGALDEVYTRLGRPEKPEDYAEFEVPEGAAVDTGRMEFATKMAHGLGLNQAQRDAMISATMEYEGAIIEESAKQLEIEQSGQLEALKKEWGSAYAEREELGRRTVRAGLPEGVDKEEALNKIEQAIGTANMLKMFANLGEQIGEDKVHDSGDGVRPYGFSPEQAKAEKAQLKEELKDPSNKDRLRAYNEGKGVDYKRMEALNQVIFGT